MVRLLFVLLLVSTITSLFGQDSWTLKHDEDDIKVWLKSKEGSDYKEFKSVTSYKYPIEQVRNAIVDVAHIPNYYHMVNDVGQIEVLDEFTQEYNLYFDFPWPVSDRVCRVKGSVEIISDNEVKITTVTAPLKKDEEEFVPCKNIDSSWMLTESTDGITSILHKGFMDPGGKIPSSIANLAIVESPVKSLINLRTHILKYAQ